MRKIIALLIILSFVLLLGCAKEAVPEVAAPSEPAPLPDMAPVEPEEEVVIPPAEPEDVEEVSAIGTRVEGTEQEAEPEEVPEDVEEIRLESDKTMSVSEMKISPGTTLAWKNYDMGWPHDLVVESGRGFDTVRHARSGRLLDNGVWEYTFNEKGTFKVRDIFSGKMWMTVVVE